MEENLWKLNFPSERIKEHYKDIRKKAEQLESTFNDKMYNKGSLKATERPSDTAVWETDRLLPCASWLLKTSYSEDAAEGNIKPKYTKSMKMTFLLTELSLVNTFLYLTLMLLYFIQWPVKQNDHGRFNVIQC